MLTSTKLAPAAAAAPLRRSVKPSTIRVSFASHRVNQVRYKGDVFRRFARDSDRQMSKQQKGAGGQMSVNAATRDAAAQAFKSGQTPLFPTTFVALPLTKYPTSPREFLSYQWHRTKNWFAGVMSVAGSKVESMGDSWTTRPRLQVGRAKIAPTGKIMYRELLEAFAAGDKDRVSELCTPAYASQFLNAIQRRKRDERVHFEMTDRDTMFYPRLSSHLIGDGSVYEKGTLMEQAVVAVSSTQKTYKTNVTSGAVIPGSEKELQRLEYVVMVRSVKKDGYKINPWRIWGTTEATTLQVMMERQAYWQKEQAKQAGWKTD